MKKTRITKLLSFSVCIVLIAAMALCMTACNDKQTASDPVSSDVTETTKQEVKKVGEGDTTFDFTVVDLDGNETKFQVATDKTTVGEALLDAGLIVGDEGEYGLYVKTVNGIALDYDTDGKYWAFYINDEYAMSGADSTDIVEGDLYTFKAE
ncbi:MAG: DUF4430 domain-containing protein [Clostridia bacterium]|nr:DUF4430 domain-containing protein [Clostridia bacterium]